MVLLGGVLDLVDQLNSHIGYVGLALLVIQDAVNLGLLGWRVAILVEVAADLGDALIDTAAGFHIGLHLLLALLDLGGLPHHYFGAVLDEAPPAIEPPHKHPHFVLDPALPFPIVRPVLPYPRITQKEAG